MSSMITNKIEFEVSSEEEARQIYEKVCVDNEFDFRALKPSYDVYCSDLDPKKSIIEKWDSDCEAYNTSRLGVVWERQLLFNLKPIGMFHILQLLHL